MPNANGLYLVALAITLVVEVPIVLAIYRRVAPLWRVAGVALAVNLLTHGLLWTLFRHLPGAYGVRVAYTEVVVVAIEAVAYRVFVGGTWARAVIASLVANAASTAASLAVWRWMFAHGGFGLLR